MIRKKKRFNEKNKSKWQQEGTISDITSTLASDLYFIPKVHKATMVATANSEMEVSAVAV